MTKSSKTKKQQQLNVHIDGNISDSNIIVGDGNTINLSAIKTVLSLFSIPRAVADFTGRVDELETLKASFRNGALISGVSGGGGIGKTELACKLAEEIAGDFPDARMSIDLRGTSEPLAVDEAMRRILEPFYPNPDQKLPDEFEQLKGLYQQTFSTRKALLLLDNASNAAQVRALIPPGPSAAIVTSRRHFTLTEFDLTPLHLDVLAGEDARTLLISACAKLKEGSDEEVDALARLCGRLPLALRVAASILNDRADWSLSHLLSRLADERTRLQRLKRADDIDLDVEAALSLSYALLDDALKGYFCQLGVFSAAFIKISAQEVWEIGDDKADEVIGKLSALSLVEVVPEPLEAGVYLYDLHDLTRLFAVNELLKDEGQAAQISQRHADHFLQWAGEANALYEKGNENILRALFQFWFIWAHLETAYQRLLPEQSAFPRMADADAWLSQFPGRCIYLLELHLSPRRRIPILEAALAAARRLNDRQVEGVHLGNLGLAYWGLGDARKAIEFYEQALVIDREIGDRRGEGNALGNLGIAYKNLGDARKAIEFYEAQLVIVREIGDRRGEGNALGNLGNAYAALGDARKAIEFYEQYLSIAREIGDRRGEGNALGNLGSAYAALGDARKAIEFYEQALVIDREIGDRRGEGADLSNLGNAYAALGDARKAIEFYEQGLELHREIGDRRGEGAALYNLGNAYEKIGEISEAINFTKQSLSIFTEIESPNKEGAIRLLERLEREAPAPRVGLSANDEKIIQVTIQACSHTEDLQKEFDSLIKELSQDENNSEFIDSLHRIVYKGARIEKRLTELLVLC